MGSLTWHCCLLLSFLYVHLQVDFTHSNQTPFRNSSSHRNQCLALLQFKNTTHRSSPQCPPCNTAYAYKSGIECSVTDSWMGGKNCCLWLGVSCYDGASVYELDLRYSCLKGTLNLSLLLQLPHLKQLILADNNLTTLIPASLSKLQELEKVDLSGNMLSGQIPGIFGNYHRTLSYIDLSRNMLSGQILDTLGNYHRNLSYIDLSSNNFSGLIPFKLCEVPNLSHLDLSHNFLNDGIPSCLFNMPSLSFLSLASNQLNGPTSQFNPTSSVLEELNLRNNKINGPIPSSIFELVNLTDLDLSFNNMTDTFKFDMLFKLQNLLGLDLSSNSLLSFSSDNNSRDTLSIDLNYLNLSSCSISEFPSFLSSLENLEFLDLSNNKIQGQILKNGSKGWVSLFDLNLSHNFLTYIEHPWKGIQNLDLSNNMLQGSILIPPLETGTFLVSNNKLIGNIPPSLCNLSTLSILDLSSNNLGGKIPECLGSSIELGLLHLQNNNLHGSIPDTFVNESLLMSLDLSNNIFEGSLPRSLNTCSYLQVMNVGNNYIRDIFPQWLGNLPSLRVIILKSNQFYGPIYDSKTKFFSLRILDISCNKFVGHLSKFFFQNLKGMMSTVEESKSSDLEDDYEYMEDNIYMVSSCDYSRNELQVCRIFDYLLSSLTLEMKGQLINFQRILKAFKAIDLSNNCFEGRIPEILGKFKSLIVLNLSHNSLTGKIPSSFGNMIALESLDLSSNKLDGSIPKQMESLTFLAVLNLSYNRLLGPIPQGGQFVTYESDFFVGNKGLCGQPLPKKCSNYLAPPLPPSVFHIEDDTAIEFDWKITMMGYGCGLVIGSSIAYIILSTGKLQWLEMLVKSQLQKKFRRTFKGM